MGKALDHVIALYMQGIRDGRPREAVAAHTGHRYTQHSTGVPDGQEGFIAFFEDFLVRHPEREIEIVRAWEDGRHVFVQAYQSLDGGQAQWVTTDFFDTDEQGRAIEHWDVISAYTGPSASGHTQIDGATEIVDLDRTEANKQIVCDMLREGLFEGATSSHIGDLIAADCVQHHATMPEGFVSLRAMAEDPDRPLNYDEIVLCVGQGNFVATLSKARWNDRPLCQCDIFRLHAGRIVEHWDNSEPVPEDTGNRGKF